MDESRIRYTNNYYDITIIQIKREDKLDKIRFFDIDEEIFKSNYGEYKNKEIYLLYYPQGEKMNFSQGFIDGISEDKDEICHKCNTKSGSSGGPIINKNYKVIGVHKGALKEFKNVGTFLKKPLEDFKDKDNKMLMEIKDSKSDEIKKSTILFEKDSKINLNNNGKNLNDIIKVKKNQENIIDKNIPINFICKIEMEVNVKDKKKLIQGIGFLCNISFKNIKVLVTYNHIINFDILNNEKNKLHMLIIIKVKK